MTNQVYDSIKRSTPANLKMSIKYALASHVGGANRTTKEILSKHLFGKYNDTTDRYIREAVSELVIDGEAIVTDTNDGGLWMAATEDEIDANIKDLSDRIDHLDARREGLYNARRRLFNKTSKAARNQDPLFDQATMQQTKSSFF